MDSSFLNILGAFITAASLAYVIIKKSNSETKASTVAGEFAMSDRLEKYINKLEERIEKMETEKEEGDWRFRTLRDNFDELNGKFNELKTQLEAVKIENQSLRLDNQAKVGRIGVLEELVKDLQKQLDEYKHIDIAKVDDAKQVLHDIVEVKLEEIKQ